MALEVVDRVFDAGLVGESLSIVWHAGEPLVLPQSYYDEIFNRLSARHYGVEIRHSFQTNATLITDAWCSLFSTWNVNIGVSIDGPEAIHDRHRKDRTGRGTHKRVTDGMRLLRKHHIAFHVIAVVTKDSLDCAREIFEFFVTWGIDRIGFNVEEAEAANKLTSISGVHSSKVRSFFNVLSQCHAPYRGKIHIREFDNAFAAIISCPIDDKKSDLRNDQTRALSILTVSHDGSFSTFSPELIDAKHLQYGNFILGNILNGDLKTLSTNPKFIAMESEIEEGCKKCAETCEYFDFCGGGAPINKYFENGSFASTETLYCRSVVKVPIDVVLESIEDELRIS